MDNFFEPRRLIKGATIVLLIAVPLAFTSYFYDAFAIVKELILRILLLLMVPLAVHLYHRKRATPIWITPLSISLFCFFIVVCVSSLFSISFTVSWKKVVELSSFLALYLIWVAALDLKDLKDYMRVICGVGFIIACYALLQHIGIDVVAWQTSYLVKMRAVSTLGNPSYLAGFLVVVAPIFLYFFIADERLFQPKAKSKGKDFWVSINKVVLVMMWIACIATIFLTYTRGAWIALTMSHLFLFFLEWKTLWTRYRKTVLVFLIVVTTAVGLVCIYDRLKDTKYEWYTFTNRLTSLKNAGELYSSRLFLWNAALRIFHDHPLTGTGPGTFSYTYLKYRYYEPQARRFTNEFMGSCHNEFLEIASSSGLFSFLAFLAIIACAFYQGVKLMRNTEEKERTAWMCVLASLVAYLVHIFFLFPTISYEILWWFFLSFLTVGYSEVFCKVKKAVSSEKRADKGRRASQTTGSLTSLQIVIMAITGAISITLLVFSIRIAMGNYYLNEAKRFEAEKQIEEARITYDRAIENNPKDTSYYLYKALLLETIMRESPSHDMATEIVTNYEKAIILIPVDPYSWVNLGRFYQYVAENFDKGYGIDAEKAYKKAIEIDPYNFLNYNYLATLYTSFGKYEVAILYFNKSIDLYPKSPMVHYNMGVLFWNKKEAELARRCFKKALELDSHYERAKAALEALDRKKTN